MFGMDRIEQLLTLASHPQLPEIEQAVGAGDMDGLMQLAQNPEVQWLLGMIQNPEVQQLLAMVPNPEVQRLRQLAENPVFQQFAASAPQQDAS